MLFVFAVELFVVAATDTTPFLYFAKFVSAAITPLRNSFEWESCYTMEKVGKQASKSNILYRENLIDGDQTQFGLCVPRFRSLWLCQKHQNTLCTSQVVISNRTIVPQDVTREIICHVSSPVHSTNSRQSDGDARGKHNRLIGIVRNLHNL